jgi:hypothetical protein
MGSTFGQPGGCGPFLERREQHGIEPDRPHAVVDFLEPDPLIDERIRDVEQVVLEAERAGIADVLDHEVVGILRDREPGRIRAPTCYAVDMIRYEASICALCHAHRN